MTATMQRSPMKDLLVRYEAKAPEIVFEWNDYLWPLVIVSEPTMMTLPVGLTQLSNSESAAASYGIVMAGTVMVLLPVLVVFTMLQRHIVNGLTQGGVKG